MGCRITGADEDTSVWCGEKDRKKKKEKPERGAYLLPVMAKLHDELTTVDCVHTYRRGELENLVVTAFTARISPL